jgi:hypothetical protein
MSEIRTGPLNLDALDESWNDALLKKIHNDKINELEDYCTFSLDIVQKEHEHVYLKCEPNDSKLGFMLQSIHSSLDNLVTKESMFYTITHMDHNSMFIFIKCYKDTSSSSKKSFDFFYYYIYNFVSKYFT